MATKSFTKEVEFKDKMLANQFVDALACSAEKINAVKYETDLAPDMKCTELTGESIKDFFDVK